MEFGVNASLLNWTAGYRIVFYASDWRLEYDLALPDAAVARFPIAIQAATNAVINEVSPRPNPEWVELANPLATSVSLNNWLLQVRNGGWQTVFTFTTQILGPFGSGSEYLQVPLPSNSLPNGGAQVRLRSGTNTIDRTTYPGNGNSGQTGARLQNPVTARPIDTSNNADFYVASSPSPGRAN